MYWKFKILSKEEIEERLTNITPTWKNHLNPGSFIEVPGYNIEYYVTLFNQWVEFKGE